MNVAIGRLWNVYDSTAIWTIDDGVYVAPEEPDEPDPGDPEEPDEEIVYTNDFAAYPDLPIYSIGSREDGMNYRMVPLETETDVFPLTYTQNGITYGICFEYARHLVGSVPETSSIAGCYDGVLCEIFNISFNGGITTVLFHYYVYNEDGGVEYSIALVGEDFINDYVVFDMMIFGGYVDFNDFMSSEYSLRSAGNTETLVAMYSYDANGNRIGLTYANGTTTTYAYNKANLVTSVLNKKGTTTLSSHSYMYYLDGNIASETANSVETAYEYDGLGRLTKENRNGTITLYTYDACGNRATMTQNNVTTTYTYDANNRFTKIKNTVTEDSNCRYWIAFRDTEINAIIITTPLTKELAIEYVKAGGSVFTVTKQEAYDLAYVAGGNVEPMYDGIHGGGKFGYYYHYHIAGHTNDAHVWYLF